MRTSVSLTLDGRNLTYFRNLAPPWPESPSKTACRTSRTCSSWCWWPPSARAGSPTAPSRRFRSENDKPTVVALREIAAGNITAEMLQEAGAPNQPEAARAGRGQRSPVPRAAVRPRRTRARKGLPGTPWTMRPRYLGLLPGIRRTPGLKDLLAKRRRPTCRRTRSSASARPPSSARRRTRARSASAARPTSPTRVAVARDPRRAAPRCRHDRRGDPARRHRGHADRQGRARAPLRQRRGRDRRRRQQARPDPLQEPRGGPGRELPQDAAGDGARPARDPGEARRPHAQHAHDRGDGAGEAPRRSRAKRSTSTRRSPSASACTASSSSSRISVSARSTRSATGCSSAR